MVLVSNRSEIMQASNEVETLKEFINKQKILWLLIVRFMVPRILATLGLPALQADAWKGHNFDTKAHR